MIDKHETTESVISYGLGCSAVVLSWICEATQLWQALALFIGVIIVAIRAIHDGVRLIRYIRKP
jgi:hypothetical protein